MTSYNMHIPQCFHCRDALKEADGPLDDKWNCQLELDFVVYDRPTLDGITEALPVYNT